MKVYEGTVYHVSNSAAQPAGIVVALSATGGYVGYVHAKRPGDAGPPGILSQIRGTPDSWVFDSVDAAAKAIVSSFDGTN